jgi:PAS domain S-box-containing protein
MKKPGKPEAFRGTKKAPGTRAAPPRRKTAPAAPRRKPQKTELSGSGTARSKGAVTLPPAQRIPLGTVTDFASIHETDSRLRESEARARAAFDHSAVGMAECALDGHWLQVNAALARMLGYGSPQELLDVPWEKFSHPDDTAVGAALLRKIERGEIDRYLRERRYLHKDGSEVWVSLSMAGVRDAQGRVNYCVETCEDITARKRAEQALLQSETRFRATFEEAAVGMAHMDLQGAWLRVNRKLAEILGYSIPELLNLSCGDTTHPDDLDSYLNALARFRAGEIETLKAEKRYIRKDGGLIWAAVNVALVRDAGGRPDYLIVNVEDISDHKRDEAKAEASLREKEVLLKEVYHRVKNNLQVVSSLLEMQGRGLKDEALREVLADSARRVKSMALVHEQLYHSHDLAQIDFGDYAKSLVENLAYSLLAAQHGIRVEVDVQDVRLGIETAIPCGLIINELVSNAIKHAFPGGSGGRVRLSFRALEAGGWLMEVSDDGVGPPAGFDPQNCTTLGMRLVSALCTQIAGNLAVDSTGPGARFSVAFR